MTQPDRVRVCVCVWREFIIANAVRWAHQPRPSAVDLAGVEASPLNWFERIDGVSE